MQNHFLLNTNLYAIMHIWKSGIVNKRKVKNILISIRTRTPENAKQVTEK